MDRIDIDKDIETGKIKGDVKFKKLYLELAKKEYVNIDSIILMMRNAASIEEALKKDLYDFTKEDLDRYFYSLNSASKNYIKGTWSRIKYYMLVANNMHVTVNNLDLTEIYTPDDLDSFVHNRYKTKYLDLRDLLDEIDCLRNYQDKAIFLLPFYGIKGNGFIDMLEFKNEYVDYKHNQININGNIINIDEDTSYFLDEATRETKLVSYADEDNTKKVNNVGFLFKTNRKRPPTRMFLLTRIDMFRKTIGFGNITINSCYISGIACRMIELEKQLKQKGELKNSIEKSARILIDTKEKEGWDCSVSSVVEAIKVIKERREESNI